MERAVDVEGLQELRRQSIRVPRKSCSSTPVGITSAAASSSTVVAVAVSSLAIALLRSRSAAATAAATTHQTTELVAIRVEILLDDQLPTLELGAMHLFDGFLGQIDGGELEDSAAAGLIVLVAEQLHVGHVANRLAKHILDFLPFHLERDVGHENTTFRRSAATATAATAAAPISPSAPASRAPIPAWRSKTERKCA